MSRILDSFLKAILRILPEGTHIWRYLSSSIDKNIASSDAIDIGDSICRALSQFANQSVIVRPVIVDGNGNDCHNPECANGMYRLELEDVVWFKVKSSSPSHKYLSLFALWNDGTIDRLTTNKKFEVSSGKEYTLPVDFEDFGFVGGGWVVYAPTSRNAHYRPARVLAIVSEKHLDIKPEILESFIGQTRAISVKDKEYLITQNDKWSFGYATCWIE